MTHMLCTRRTCCLPDAQFFMIFSLHFRFSSPIDTSFLRTTSHNSLQQLNTPIPLSSNIQPYIYTHSEKIQTHLYLWIPCLISFKIAHPVDYNTRPRRESYNVDLERINAIIYILISTLVFLFVFFLNYYSYTRLYV